MTAAYANNKGIGACSCEVSSTRDVLQVWKLNLIVTHESTDGPLERKAFLAYFHLISILGDMLPGGVSRDDAS